MFAGKLFSSRADNKQNLEVRYQKAVQFLCYYPNIRKENLYKGQCNYNITNLTLWQQMILGTHALSVCRGPEHFRHTREVSMATLRVGTTPARNCHVTLKGVQQKKLLTCPILTQDREPQCEVGGLGARIRNDSPKQQQKENQP